MLHIADFGLQAVLRTEQRGAREPAALFSGTSKKSVVLLANALARRAGVEPGMTAPQAVARCPRLLIRSPQPGAEAEARAALLAVGFTLSPTIEDTGPGICTADLKGNRSPPEPLATAALAQLRELGLSATAGIARTPLLALYAARQVGRVIPNAPSPDDRSPSERRVEDNPPCLSEPLAPYLTTRDSVTLVSVANEKIFLAPLPLASADPAPELAAVLHGWGLRTFGDLAALPRDEIIRRFGSAGLDLWQRTHGGEPRPLHPVVPPRAFSATMEFEHEIETLEPLLFILQRFLDRLTLELRASQHVAAEIHLRLALGDDAEHARHFRLPEPTADPQLLFRALHTHLESLTTAAPIVALELRLTPARPLVRQQDLFETGLRDPHGFAETLARVSALVGSDRVGTPQLEDTHRPDAVKLCPAPAVIAPPAAPPLHPPLGLALRRFRPPIPAHVNAVVDSSCLGSASRNPDSAPSGMGKMPVPPETRCPDFEMRSYLWSATICGEIASRSAVYPSSGDWWQADRAWSRLEWDIALAEGGLYRLVQVGSDFFLEGEYD